MKNCILSFVMLVGIIKITQAQCGSQPFFQQGKKILFTTTIGQSVSKTTYTVKSVSSQGGGQVATLDSKIERNDGQPADKNSGAITNVSCTGSAIVFTLTTPFPGNTTLTLVQDYPLNMKVGDSLTDVTASAAIHFSASDTKQMTMTMHRKITAQESITTPAGTWMCYKITISNHTEITGRQMPAGTGDSQSFQWFNPSIGFVKSYQNAGSGDIAVTSELTSIQ